MNPTILFPSKQLDNLQNDLKSTVFFNLKTPAPTSPDLPTKPLPGAQLRILLGHAFDPIDYLILQLIETILRGAGLQVYWPTINPRIYISFGFIQCVVVKMELGPIA